MADRLRSVAPLAASLESVAQRPWSASRRFVDDAPLLLASFCLVLQLACTLDDRHPSTAENAIEASGGTAGTSQSREPELPMSSGGSAGAGLGEGTDHSEGVPSVQLNPAGDAGTMSASPTVPNAGSMAAAP